MTDKEKIRAEIEKLKEKGYPINTFEGSAGYYDALDEVLNFIDSLPEEPVSNSDWLTELQEKLDNATPEQLEELWNKYNGVDEEEPVSEDLEKASKEWLIPQLDKSYANYGETKMMELTHFDGYAMLDAIEFGAQWQGEKGVSYEDVIDSDDEDNVLFLENIGSMISLEDNFNSGDKVIVQIRKKED